MEDLGCFMLDGLHLHQMRGVLPRSIAVTKTSRWKNDLLVYMYMCVYQWGRSQSGEYSTHKIHAG